MPPARRTCAIIVVNFGSSGLLLTNLAPLSRALAAAGSDATIVVVDNWSSTEERERIGKLSTDEGWVLVAEDRNLGFGGGVNAGVARAAEIGATRLVLLNPDAVLGLEQFAALDEAVAGAPRTLFAPRVVRPDGTTWSAGSQLDLADGRVRSLASVHAGSRAVAWLSGACLAMSLDLWREVGGMADEYFLYWEDVEFSYRAVQVGGQLAVLDDVQVIHDPGGTQRTAVERDRGKSSQYYYFNIRNRLLFAARNLDDDDVRSWQRASGAVAREVMLRGGRRQFLTRPFSLTSAFVRGRRDGRRIARARLRDSA